MQQKRPSFGWLRSTSVIQAEPAGGGAQAGGAHDSVGSAADEI
jgi:hypothetical protein